MFQAFFDRFADALFPIICGLLVWFGVHYLVLTPRILKVEMPQVYDQQYANRTVLPKSVHDCLKTNYAESLLTIGRLEATLFTASHRKISASFQKKAIEAIDRLDQACGTSIALQAEQERRQLAEEARLQAQKERLIAYKEQKRLEAEQLRAQAKAKAERLALENKINMARHIFNWLTQGQ